MIEGLLVLVSLLIIPVTAGVWSGRQIDRQRASPESVGLRVIAIVVGLSLCLCIYVIVHEERAAAEFAASRTGDPRAIAPKEFSLGGATLGGALQGIAMGLLLAGC